MLKNITVEEWNGHDRVYKNFVKDENGEEKWDGTLNLITCETVKERSKSMTVTDKMPFGGAGDEALEIFNFLRDKLGIPEELQIFDLTVHLPIDDRVSYTAKCNALTVLREDHKGRYRKFQKRDWRYADTLLKDLFNGKVGVEDISYFSED